MCAVCVSVCVRRVRALASVCACVRHSPSVTGNSQNQTDHSSSPRNTFSFCERPPACREREGKKTARTDNQQSPAAAASQPAGACARLPAPPPLLPQRPSPSPQPQQAREHNRKFNEWCAPQPMRAAVMCEFTAFASNIIFAVRTCVLGLVMCHRRATENQHTPCDWSACTTAAA